MALKSVRGKEGIIVWRRSGWTSMPHLLSPVGWPEAMTRCGHEVSLGNGTVAIVLTQISSDMFMATGCGSCAQAMLRDLREELRRAHPNAKEKLRALLRELNWADTVFP